MTDQNDRPEPPKKDAGELLKGVQAIIAEESRVHAERFRRDCQIREERERARRTPAPTSST